VRISKVLLFLAVMYSTSAFAQQSTCTSHCINSKTGVESSASCSGDTCSSDGTTVTCITTTRDSEGGTTTTTVTKTCGEGGVVGAKQKPA